MSRRPGGVVALSALLMLGELLVLIAILVGWLVAVGPSGSSDRVALWTVAIAGTLAMIGCAAFAGGFAARRLSGRPLLAAAGPLAATLLAVLPAAGAGQWQGAGLWLVAALVGAGLGIVVASRRT